MVVFKLVQEVMLQNNQQKKLTKIIMLKRMEEASEVQLVVRLTELFK